MIILIKAKDWTLDSFSFLEIDQMCLELTCISSIFLQINFVSVSAYHCLWTLGTGPLVFVLRILIIFYIKYD